MRLYYRYDNVVREVLALNELLGTYHGVVIPATIAIYYKNSVSSFLENYRNPYFIDPLTYFINQPAKNICNRQNNARRSYKMLIQDYLNFDVEEIDDIHLEEDSIWDFSDDNIEFFCQNVIDFQMECFKDPEMMDFLNEYLEEEEQQENLPELLMTPYVLIENDETYEFNRRLAETSFEIYEGEIPLFACITISKEYLGRNPNLEHRIIDNFNFTNNFIIWESDFNAIYESVTNLLRFKNIVRILSQEGENTVINLYGDYFSLLLSKLGLNGFCSGLRGGTKKRARLSRGGGGGGATNVYVPQIRRFLLEDDFRAEIQRDERLICNCRKCDEINDGLIIDDPIYPEPYANDLMDEKRYLEHFLLCRQEENINIEEMELEDLLNDLREKTETYAISAYINHMTRWANDL